MTTKQKLEMIRLEAEQRQLMGCRNLLSDNSRALKAEVYADVLRRHPKALESRRFHRVVRAVNNLIAV